jgi:CubicO group peptidase (beta-lactamase class C family)
VDVWGGFADADRTIPWQRDTITNVWSVTKTMTALCALVLADRGELDLAAPVGRYWPEFAVAGKEKVLVRHLLAHTAGLPDWDGPIEDLYDWPAATARLAAQAPQWEPGSAAGYHSLTQGFLVGEDYAASAAASAAPASAGTAVRVRDGNSVAWRRAQIPAANGLGNARSVALVQSVMACGGAVRGRRLLSQAGCDRARQEQFHGVDRILGMQVRWGLGYGLFGSSLGWGGWGGSIVMIEPGERMAVAYVTNQMREPADDNRGLEIIMAAYDGLKALRA